jgi:branched-chain amino acid transport system substrate-binding protein
MKRTKSYPQTIFSILTLLLLITLFVSACASPTPTAQPATTAAPAAEEPTQKPAELKTAKIGVMAPVTGSMGADAQDMVNSAQLAVDDYNAKGGVAGYKLELVVADTVDMRSDAVTSAFNRLKNTQDLNVIIAPYASTSNFEIDLMAQENMPYILSANAAQTRDIISKDPSKYPTVWSRVPSYDAYNTELPKLLEKYDQEGKIKLRDRKAFIVSSDDPYGTTIANGMKKQFEELKWTITGFETVPFGSVTDWRGILAKVREDPPDIVVVTDWAPPNNAAFMNQFMENPPNSLLFLQYGPSVQEFLDLTKNNSTGLIYNNLGAPVDTLQEVKDFRARWKQKFGNVGGYYAVAGYEEVQIYAACLQKVGDPTKRLDIGNCIGQTDMKTFTGRLKFDQTTHLAMQGEDFYPILFYQIWEGTRFLIEPKQYADGTFRLPPWMKQ